MNTKMDNTSLHSLLSALAHNLSAEDILLSGLQSDIATAIASRRIELGLSQADLARSMGVTQALVSRWENGDVNFQLKTLVRIAQQLSIPLQSPFVSPSPAPYRTVDNLIYPNFGWSSSSFVGSSYLSDPLPQEM